MLSLQFGSTAPVWASKIKASRSNHAQQFDAESFRKPFFTLYMPSYSHELEGKLIYRVVYEWKKKILYSEPILNGQSSISAELQLAPEDSSGSLLTDVEKKLSDSLTAHAEPGRDRKRERGNC